MINAQFNTLSEDQPVFDALADPARRALISVLAANEGITITRLSSYVSISRQAVSKHLRIIEAAGFVSIEQQGRERLLTFSPKPLQTASTWMQQIEVEWDMRMDNLRRYVLETASESDQPTRTEPQ